MCFPRGRLAGGTALFLAWTLSLHFAAARLAFAAGGSTLQTRQQSTSPPSSPERDIVEFVYRGDDRPPEDIIDDGGFLPCNMDYQSPEHFSLFQHTRQNESEGWQGTAYISTTTSFSTATDFSGEDGGFAYRIRATPNMIDVDYTLDDMGYDGDTEAEFAALGGVRWGQVTSWVRIPRNFRAGSLGFDDMNPQHNPQYNHTFDQYNAVEAPVPQLAGLPGSERFLRDEALAFMDRNGQAIGWSRAVGFPIWDPDSEDDECSSGRTSPQSRRSECASGESASPCKKRKTDGSLQNAHVDLSAIEIPPELRQSLQDADPRTTNCDPLILELLLLYPTLRSVLPRRRRRHDVADPSSCHRLADMAALIREHNVPKCRTIDRLTVELTLGNDMGAGTTDSLYVMFDNNRHATLVAEAPSSGDETTTNIDLAQVFGRKTISLASIGRRILIRQTPVPHPLARDDWQLGGTSLQVHCVESDRHLRLDKHKAVNKWIHSESEDASDVWSGSFAFSDWQPTDQLTWEDNDINVIGPAKH